MKKKERSAKWLKIVVVVLLLGYAFIAGVAFDKNAVATIPEPEPEKAFYTRWYQKVFPPEVEEVPIPEVTIPEVTAPEMEPELS